MGRPPTRPKKLRDGFYIEIRNKFYDELKQLDTNFSSYDNFEKFLYINNEYKPNLAKYLSNVMVIRKNVLFENNLD